MYKSNEINIFALMKAVIQRVRSASVEVQAETIASINQGLLVLVGITTTDTSATAEWMASKLTALRIFPDQAGRMNLSVNDVGGDILLVSQFTLCGNVQKGTRPSFIEAAATDIAEPLFNELAGKTRLLLHEKGQLCTGRFGTMMNVSLINEGPVTIILDRNTR